MLLFVQFFFGGNTQKTESRDGLGQNLIHFTGHVFLS